MATATKKNTEKMVEVFALWKKKSQKGNTYFNGKDSEKKNLRGFFNTTKKNPKEPDLKVYYTDAEGTVEKDPLVSMWVNTSAAGKKYLTGKIGEKRVVGFISESENEKYPYLRVFYATEKTEEKQEKIDPVVCDDVDDDLPF